MDKCYGEVKIFENRNDKQYYAVKQYIPNTFEEYQKILNYSQKSKENLKFKTIINVEQFFSN